MKKIMKKVILFYNPNSGNGLFQSNLDNIIEKFQLIECQIIPIRAANGHILENVLENLDKETYKEEYKQIIAAGGDGTINVCVNAMVKNNIDLPLAIMPAGTANDFAYYFGIPSNITKTLEIATGTNFTYSDVGMVNGRCFINVSALGSVVDVSQKTDPTMKNTLGVFSYYLKAISELSNLKSIKVKITTPEKIHEETMYFMVVMNGKSAGGFKNISPNSNINDGLLDVIIFKNMPMRELPQLLFLVLQGNHPESKNVIHFSTSELTIEANEDVPTDIDGEIGEKLPLHFTVLHNKLKILTEYNNVR